MPGTVVGAGDAAPIVEELPFHLEGIVHLCHLSGHCPVELSTVIGMFFLCAVQCGSH